MKRAVLWLALGLVATVAAAQSLGPQQTRMAREHYEKGLSLMASESWDEAVEEFQAAIELDSYLVAAHYNLGQCRMAQRRYVEAVQAYTDCRKTIERLGSLTMKERGERDRARRDEINELKDSLRRLPNLKGVNVMRETVRIEDRIRFLESMEMREGEPPEVPAEVPLALGSAYFRQNKLADAERWYAEAVDLDNKLCPAHNNLAVIYLLSDRLDQAEEAIQRAERCGFRVNPNLKRDVEEAQQAARANP